MSERKADQAPCRGFFPSPWASYPRPINRSMVPKMRTRGLPTELSDNLQKESRNARSDTDVVVFCYHTFSLLRSIGI